MDILIDLIPLLFPILATIIMSTDTTTWQKLAVTAVASVVYALPIVAARYGIAVEIETLQNVGAQVLEALGISTASYMTLRAAGITKKLNEFVLPGGLKLNS